MKIIELKQDIFRENEVTADGVRKELSDANTLMINVMSSPGSGKTTTLVRTINMLKDKYKIGVMECDIDASVDAETVQKAGAYAIQLHTGGMCHMDAAMTKQGLMELDCKDADLIFIENVGNLVCPAEFDTGAHLNITILSVPEGDDKPAKYPLVYEVSDVVLINKIDAISVFDFDTDKCIERIKACNPKSEVFLLSSKTGEGFEGWISWLEGKLGGR
ncbi:MAG: hydrogenase nickel incorporation protein HypB [Lachnospiraceae bacterium]|nr:hydrogenase nickel incorporation protein HypB [Lachnospiraceae bacterium]